MQEFFSWAFFWEAFVQWAFFQKASFVKGFCSDVFFGMVTLLEGHFLKHFFLGVIFSWAFFHVLKVYFAKVSLRGLFSWLEFYQRAFFRKRKYFLEILFPWGIFLVEIFPGYFLQKHFFQGNSFAKGIICRSFFPGLFSWRHLSSGLFSRKHFL